MNQAHCSDFSIPLVRSEYVMPYIDLLRRAGTPVDRELRRARLPTLIEELPEAYVSIDLVFRFLMNCARSEDIDDLGFEAGWKLTFEDFGSGLKNALRAAPTLKAAIETFSRLASIEDSEFRCRLLRDGETARICIQQYVPAGGDGRIAEWQNLKAIIEIVRRYVRPDWLPTVIGFESQIPISGNVRDRLGEVRIMSAQQNSFVQLPSRLLAQPLLPQDGFFRITPRTR